MRLILAGMAFGLFGFFLLVLPGEGNTGRLLPAWIGDSVIAGSLTAVLLGFWLLASKGFVNRFVKPVR